MRPRPSESAKVSVLTLVTALSHATLDVYQVPIAKAGRHAMPSMHPVSTLPLQILGLQKQRIFPPQENGQRHQEEQQGCRDFAHWSTAVIICAESNNR